MTCSSCRATRRACHTPEACGLALPEVRRGFFGIEAAPEPAPIAVPWWIVVGASAIASFFVAGLAMGVLP